MKWTWLRDNQTHLNDEPSLKQLENLFPGVYYRMKVVPNVAFTHIGKSVHKVMGYEAKELFGKATLTSLQHPEYQEIIETKKKLCIQSREAKKLEYHLYTRSGKLKLVRDHFIGEYNRIGRLIAINGYFKEIKGISVKRQLHKQLEAYRAAIDVNIISSITDSKGIIIYSNDNFKKISQYTDEEILGKTHNIVSSGYHPRSFFEDMWRTISSGKMWTGEILNRAKDGSFYWVDTIIIPIVDTKNKITSYLSLRMPINARKQAEEQREKYIRVLEQMAHMVSHDLRGPVCSILGLLQFFENLECKSQDVKKASDYLVCAARKLDQITRELSASIYAADLEMKGNLPEQPKDVSKWDKPQVRSSHHGSVYARHLADISTNTSEDSTFHSDTS